jgi:4,5-DOPA dioxygenase extradiol
MERRAALKLLLAAGWSLVGGCRNSQEPESMTSTQHTRPQVPERMPVIFIAHGSPLLLDDAGWVAELKQWAQAMPRPKSVLMLSAHWEQQPVTLGATRTVPLVYDFYGFPSKYYTVTYTAPGAPALAERVRLLLTKTQSVAEAPERGLDHGAYVPLVAMYPDADVPVLQVSLPTLDASALFALGRTLAPLRREGVLVVGSGFLTHNLRALDLRPDPVTPSWAAELDAWAADVLARQDVDALLDYRSRAPGVRQALPTHEHFVPVIVAMGAAIEEPGSVQFPIAGFIAGSLTRRSVQFG